jgi:hypothetical protein
MAWAPAYGEERRKDYRRAQARAQALRKRRIQSVITRPSPEWGEESGA